MKSSIIVEGKPTKGYPKLMTIEDAKLVVLFNKIRKT